MMCFCKGDCFSRCQGSERLILSKFYIIMWHFIETTICYASWYDVSFSNAFVSGRFYDVSFMSIDISSLQYFAVSVQREILWCVHFMFCLLCGDCKSW